MRFIIDAKYDISKGHTAQISTVGQRRDSFSYFLFEKRGQLTGGWDKMAAAINSTATELDRNSGTKLAGELTAEAIGHRNFDALDAKLMDTFNNVYIPDKNLRKEASPLNFKSLPKFPPTLILSSGCDILLNQDEEFANLLLKHNAKVRHVCVRGATHIYLTMPGMPKSFSIALQETLDFIKKTRS